MNYKLILNVPNHLQLQNSITLKLWPEFMLQDPVAKKNWVKLFELFPEYQISLESDGEIIGTANSLPFHWDKDFKELPERGWDWVLEKGIKDKQEGIEPNMLNGLQIAVNREHQGQGVSSLILKEMILLAEDRGFKFVTIPVRPSLKHQYPLIQIDNYMNWKREDGLPYDSWLRVHVRNGGELIKSCKKAMYIPGTVSEWEKWTDLKFFESGKYIINKALKPVEVNVEKNIGEYWEPNVWVVHCVEK